MFAYPSEFPSDEAKSLLTHFSSGTVEPSHLAHAAWVFSGWGLAITMPVPIGGFSAPTLNEGQAALVESVARAAGVEKPRAAAGDPSEYAAIDWLALLEKLLPLILALLKK